MHSFEALTPKSQAARLRNFVRDVLTSYPVLPEGLRIRTVARSFNTVLRVRSSDGFDGALRLGPQERIHAQGTEEVEIAWMRSLAADGVASPPQVIAARDGRVVVHHQRVDVPGTRVCVLFDWVPGRPLREAMSAPRAEELGCMAALLHEYAAATRPAHVPPVLVADRVLYWLTPNLLLLAPGASMLAEALERATSVLTSLWADPPNAPHIVHGDLTPSNVIVHQGRLRPIDFQDLVWGLDIWDLSISIASLQRFDQTGSLRERFHQGYAAVREWPDVSSDVMTALIAARRLHQLNLTLNLDRPDAGLAVERMTRSIAEWMKDER